MNIIGKPWNKKDNNDIVKIKGSNNIINISDTNREK